MKITVTATHKGEKKTLTVPQWSRLLGVEPVYIYARIRYGANTKEVIEELITPKVKRSEIDFERIDQLFEVFNFSNGIFNMWRQKNGVR